jgi:hypothetical protein
MSAEETIRTRFPLHLAKLYEISILESEPRLQIIKLVELFENSIRHLALIGFAEYLQCGIHNDKVDTARLDLGKPSLGHWLALLRAVDSALIKKGLELITPPVKTGYKEGPIYAACQALAPLAGIDLPKRVKISYFLDLVVQFRNKKIGHGSLSSIEANSVIQPFEAGLITWLTGLNVLQERHLVYISRVEYRDPHYIYTGTDLTRGTSLFPVNIEGNVTITPQQVYLYRADDEIRKEFTPLFPFFTYDNDSYLLYVYNELSNKGKPILRCSYDSSGMMGTIELDAQPTLILGEHTGEEPRTPQPEPKTKPSTIQNPPISDEKPKDISIMKSWYDIITPHEDIRKGEFDEAIFAADLGDVASGKAPEDYRDPYLFYKKTYQTQGLRNLLARVHQTLATGKGSSVIQIQTPFGGGKTHALVAIYHYLKHGVMIKELLPPGLELISPQVAAIVGNHWNPIEGFSSEGLTRRTFWGELGYQIGGRAGYEAFRPGGAPTLYHPL